MGDEQGGDLRVATCPAPHRPQAPDFVLSLCPCFWQPAERGERVCEKAETQHVEAWPPASPRWRSGATSLQVLPLLSASTHSMSSFSLLINTP